MPNLMNVNMDKEALFHQKTDGLLDVKRSAVAFQEHEEAKQYEPESPPMTPPIKDYERFEVVSTSPVVIELYDNKIV